MNFLEKKICLQWTCQNLIDRRSKISVWTKICFVDLFTTLCSTQAFPMKSRQFWRKSDREQCWDEVMNESVSLPVSMTWDCSISKVSSKTHSALKSGGTFWWIRGPFPFEFQSSSWLKQKPYRGTDIWCIYTQVDAIFRIIVTDLEKFHGVNQINRQEWKSYIISELFLVCGHQAHDSYTRNFENYQYFSCLIYETRCKQGPSGAPWTSFSIQGRWSVSLNIQLFHIWTYLCKLPSHLLRLTEQEFCDSHSFMGS